jgi:fructose-bisphosphate aldolase class II
MGVKLMTRKASHIEFFEQTRNPLPGGILFKALQPPREIILAANTRVTLDAVVGILQAAKDTEQIVIFELALSEMDRNGGYTGLTPKAFAERVKKAAEIVGWYGYVLHADHITIKKGTDEEIENIKKEIDARIEAGFTSFAIDSSFLFNRNAKAVPEQLKEIIRTGIILFQHIDERMDEKNYGKEGEVGEIGIEEFTTVEEAVHYVDKLKENGVELDCLAIANGSKHGVSVDAEGKIIPQLSINIQRTVEIVDALRKRGHRTGIAQHGITGTPIPLIAEKFPKGKVIKGNVGTEWMLIVWDILQIFEPQLYQKIYNWTLEKYMKSGVPAQEIFVSNSKYAIKPFFNDLEKISEDTKRAIRAKAYSQALIFFKAFGMEKTAERVYRYLSKNKIEY